MEALSWLPAEDVRGRNEICLCSACGSSDFHHPALCHLLGSALEGQRRMVSFSVSILCTTRPHLSLSHSLTQHRYTPFLAIVAAAIPASGAPIAGGIIFIPVLQLDSLTLRNAIAFSSATQMLGVGVFAPVCPSHPLSLYFYFFVAALACEAEK